MVAVNEQFPEYGVPLGLTTPHPKSSQTLIGTDVSGRLKLFVWIPVDELSVLMLMSSSKTSLKYIAHPHPE